MFTNPQLLDMQAAVVNILLSCRDTLMVHYGTAVHTSKADKSVVTKLDRWVEDSLREALYASYPTIGFRGEETGQHGSDEIYWLVDPIDGTEHFVRGYPPCSNMVTLVYNAQPVVSVIYDFVNDYMYRAARGLGAFKNEQRLTVSTLSSESRFMFLAEVNAATARGLSFNTKLHQSSEWVMSFATGGMSCTPIAEGLYEGRVSYEAWAQDYDVAPGALLIQEAGGILVPFDGSEYTTKCVNLYMGSRQGYDYLVGSGLFDDVLRS